MLKLLNKLQNFDHFHFQKFNQILELLYPHYQCHHGQGQGIITQVMSSEGTKHFTDRFLGRRPVS